MVFFKENRDTIKKNTTHTRDWILRNGIRRHSNNRSRYKTRKPIKEHKRRKQKQNGGKKDSETARY